MLTKPLFSLCDEQRKFLLKRSFPPIYFCRLVIASPHTSEPENHVSHPSLMHTFIPTANFITFEYLHSKACACRVGLAVSSNNKT